MRVNVSNFFMRNDNHESCFYTISGQGDYIDDNGMSRTSTEKSNTYAKKIKNKKNKTLLRTNSFTYYVISKPNKRLFDPSIIHSVENKNKINFIDSVCKGGIGLIEVNESVFNKYLNFLKTKNISWLEEAQKELV